MIRPLRDRIVVKPLEQPYEGLIQVVRLDNKTSRGEILAVGPKAEDCKVGDVIQFTDIFKFPPIIDHGVKCLILQEADIAGIEESGSFNVSTEEAVIAHFELQEV